MIPNHLSATWTALPPALGNHLWQSTLFAIMAGLLTLILRKNQARVRHWLWLAASVKFLIPFSLLVGIGNHLGWSTAPAKEYTALSYLMDEISQPFTPTVSKRGVSAVPGADTSVLPYIVVAAWFCGSAAVLLSWWLR